MRGASSVDGEEFQILAFTGKMEDWNAAVRIRKFFVEEGNRELEATLVGIIILIIIIILMCWTRRVDMIIIEIFVVDVIVVAVIIIIIISWNVSQNIGQISERALIRRQHFVVGVASDW